MGVHDGGGIVCLLQRRPELSRAEFPRWWTEDHIPLVRAFPGLRKYAVSLTTRTGEELTVAAPAFPSLAWFRALADRLESDADFRHLARWTHARIGFAVTGAPTIVLTIVDGRIVSVHEGEGLRAADYALEGPREGWDILFEERGVLPLATNQLHGTLRLRGDLVLAAGDNWTLANIVRRFRDVSAEGVTR